MTDRLRKRLVSVTTEGSSSSKTATWRPSGVRARAKAVSYVDHDVPPAEHSDVRLFTLDDPDCREDFDVADDGEDEDDRASNAPTLPPPRVTVRNPRDELAPLHELLYRFEVGDHKGALAAAETLLDRSLVPMVLVPQELLPALALDPRAALLVSCIDGATSLEAVLEASTMPMLEALRALCELLEQRVVTLR
jgi:hypothetical protein